MPGRIAPREGRLGLAGPNLPRHHGVVEGRVGLELPLPRAAAYLLDRPGSVDEGKHLPLLRRGILLEVVPGGLPGTTSSTRAESEIRVASLFHSSRRRIPSITIFGAEIASVIFSRDSILPSRNSK